MVPFHSKTTKYSKKIKIKLYLKTAPFLKCQTLCMFEHECTWTRFGIGIFEDLCTMYNVMVRGRLIRRKTPKSSRSSAMNYIGGPRQWLEEYFTLPPAKEIVYLEQFKLILFLGWNFFRNSHLKNGGCNVLWTWQPYTNKKSISNIFLSKRKFIWNQNFSINYIRLFKWGI